MLTPPCEIACDTGEPVRGWLHALQADDVLRAWRMITRMNPLPACMGRICYAPCEQRCVLGARTGAVGIRALEAAVGELALREGWRLDEPRESTGVRVVVVGSGPCGLSATHQLVLAGHEVTLLDAHHCLGGMLRRGITERRLPKRILDAEIQRIVSGRARVQTSRAVRRIGEVLSKCDGVIWAAGASRCMAVVEGRTIWRQPIHTDRSARRTATLSIGRGARAAEALSDHLLGSAPSGLDSGATTAAAAPSAALPAPPGSLKAATIKEANRCILCGSRGALRRPRTKLENVSLMHEHRAP